MFGRPSPRKPLAVEDLDKITLRRGPGTRRSLHICAMQVVCWLNGEPRHTKYTYQTPCTNRNLATYIASINDNATNKDRQRLKPYLPYLVGALPSELEVASMASELLRDSTILTVDDGIALILKFGVNVPQEKGPYLGKEMENFLRRVEQGKVPVKI